MLKIPLTLLLKLKRDLPQKTTRIKGFCRRVRGGVFYLLSS